MHPEELAERNIRRSRWYLLGGGLVFAAMAYVLGTVWFGAGPVPGILAALIAAAITWTSYWESDRIVVASTGAVPADLDDHRRLHNLVESVSIAAGIPKPRVYIVRSDALNAFATGRDPEHAAVAVTSGLLDNLDRQELEAVVAHEVSHVRNYDIRLMTVVAVIAGAIVLLADWSFRAVRWGGLSGSRRKADGVVPLLVILGLVMVILAPLGARIIRSAVSRQREYLADVSGAHLTHNPRALADALRKIADSPSRVRNATHANAHLWIDAPLRPRRGRGTEGLSWYDRMFLTHPPIEERIHRLELLGA